MKSHLGSISSTEAKVSIPSWVAAVGASTGSYPITFISKPLAALRATSRPILPSPNTPRVLPVSWQPRNLLFSHFPALMLASAAGTCLAIDINKLMVCSAVLKVLASGVFITTIPLRVAAATSMLSTPTPPRTITLSLPGFSIRSAVMRVPLRTTTPSARRRAALSSSPFKPGLSSSSMPALRKISRPGSSILSLINTLGITILQLLGLCLNSRGK